MRLRGFPGVEVDLSATARGPQANAQFHSYACALAVPEIDVTPTALADAAENAAKSVLRYAGLCAAIAFGQDILPWLTLGQMIIARGEKPGDPDEDRGVIHLISKTPGDRYVEIKWDSGIGILRQTPDELADELRAEEVLRLP